MNKIKALLIKFSGVLAAIAFVVVSASSNSACFCTYHQPKTPKGLEKFRKF